MLGASKRGHMMSRGSERGWNGEEGKRARVERQASEGGRRPLVRLGASLFAYAALYVPRCPICTNWNEGDHLGVVLVHRAVERQEYAW